MASLANQTISSTYDGLIKTSSDNAVPVSGVQALEDGSGNALALSVGRSGNGVTVSGNLAVDTNTLYVDAANNKVGINNSTPNSFFSNASQLVVGDGSTSRGMTIYGSSAGDSQIFFADGTTGDEQYRGAVRYEHSSDSMVMFTSGSEKVRIDSSGNVGIGITPDGGAMLDIAKSDLTNGSILRLTNSISSSSWGDGTPIGTLQFYTTDPSGAGVKGFIKCLQEGSSSTYPSASVLSFGTRNTSDPNGAERMRIDSSGNVILNTGGSFTTGTTNSLRFSPSNSLDRYASINVENDGSNNLSMYFETRDAGVISERMRIDSSGNVGIGGSPITKLTLEGVRNTNTLTLRSTSNDSAWSSGDEFGAIEFYSNDASGGGVGVKSAISCFTTSSSGANSELTFSTSSTGTNNVERMRIDSIGNVKLASTTSQSIDFTYGAGGAAKAGMLIDYSAGEYRNYVGEGGNSYFYSFYTNGSEKMRIESGGEVKIGTTTVNSNGLTIEKTGNHLFLRATSAPAGEYWNFDINSNNRLSIINDNVVGVFINDGDTSWSAGSDESLKENITELTGVLDKIDSYRCVEYNLIGDDKKKIGFIAQDWQTDFEPIVSADEDGILSMKYTETIPVLLKAIQELSAKVAALESQLNA